jgi:pimeloyl-ACP methyl ester carboxylesterase
MRVVLLHALPLTGAMWHRQLSWLPASSLAPTLYDMGGSITEWARTVHALCGDEQLFLVGASVGGFCALEMARLAPEQVRAVVLVGSKAGVRRDDDARDYAVRRLREDGSEGAWTEFWEPLFGPSSDRRVRDEAKAACMEVGVDRLVGGVRTFFDRDDLSAFAQGWDHPVHAISGAHDRAPSPATSMSAVNPGKGGTFHLIADSGHYVSLEQPATFDHCLQQLLGLKPSSCRGQTGGRGDDERQSCAGRS